ncbi:RICIN domain-containing protein [Kitasatospora sp. McL0602]|uniref:RICIN domain-containing protein n=1 Tax=Kitasatospora sp. McL0602 TaxID=3439530 RepID=UPI003F8CC80A
MRKLLTTAGAVLTAIALTTPNAGAATASAHHVAPNAVVGQVQSWDMFPELGVDISDIANYTNHQNERADFVRALGDRISAKIGNLANVLVVDDTESYAPDLHDVNVDMVVKYDASHPYHVYVFQSGNFTLNGDGGWIHWGMWGRYDRSGDAGRTVSFYPPGGTGPAHGRVATLQSAHGTVADLDNASVNSGTSIKAWEPNGNEAQQWVFWDKGNGNWQIETQYRGGLLMDYNFNSWRTWLVGANGGNNQLWQFQDAGNGWYQIKSARDGGCLTADTSGTALGVWSCNGGDGQRWHLVNSGA